MESVNFDLFYWSGEKDQVDSFFKNNPTSDDSITFKKIENSALYNIIIKNEEGDPCVVDPDSYILTNLERKELLVLSSAEFRDLIKQEGVAVSSVGEEQ